ncbi:MAG: SAM-dependent methyltransferase [Gammaproteobacteria bacterium]|nr:MAG: SAM-dependent methyltransferase [Gammaproteobacteria bacterium]
MSLPVLRLKKNEERRLRAGHLWIFSNEVDTAVTPLDGFEPGEQVRVETARGETLGVAYVNPHSLICARLLARRGAPFTSSDVVHRLKIALGLRRRAFDVPCYRLVHGEADLLPGLVVDRYGDDLVVQLNTAGMERLREAVLDALHKVLRPRSILLRNDAPVRALEGLPETVETVHGEVPARFALRENGLDFVAPASGQKTGWYYDMRAVRAWLLRWARGARVLDVFSYAGGFGVHAAAGGAAEVHCVESSPVAVEALRENFARNGFADRLTVHQGDAFEVLARLKADGARFDLVVVDPPAFIKRKKDARAGLAAYRRLNEAALRLLGKDGLLVSASCSMHLPAENLADILRAAGRHLDRHVEILAAGGQDVDHPVHPAIPETRYLKAFLARAVLV